MCNVPKERQYKFASYKDVKEVADELFESLRSRYQGNLKTSMAGNDFIFGLVQLMYCKYAKVNLQRGGSHTDSTECIKKSNHKPQKIQIINVFNMW